MAQAGTVSQNSLTLERFSKIFEQVRDARNQGLFCDVTIEVEGRRFSAHKLILISNSEYFKTMFSSNFLESDKLSVTLKGMSADSFHHLLEYMYGTSYQIVDIEEASEVLQAADMLFLRGIFCECEQELAEVWPKFANLDILGSIALQFNMSCVLQSINDAIRKAIMKDFYDSPDWPLGDVKSPIQLLQIPENLLFDCLVTDERLRTTRTELGALNMSYTLRCVYSFTAIEIYMKSLFAWLYAHKPSQIEKFLPYLCLKSLPFEKASSIARQACIQNEQDFAPIFNGIRQMQETVANQQHHICLVSHQTDFVMGTCDINISIFNFTSWTWQVNHFVINCTVVDVMVHRNLIYFLAHDCIRVWRINPCEFVTEHHTDLISNSMAVCISATGNEIYSVYKDEKRSICHLVIYNLLNRQIFNKCPLFFEPMEKIKLLIKDDNLFILNSDINTLHLLRLELQNLRLECLWRERDALIFYDLRHTVLHSHQDKVYMFAVENLFKIAYDEDTYQEPEHKIIGSQINWEVNCVLSQGDALILGVLVENQNIKLISFDHNTNISHDLCVLPPHDILTNHETNLFMQSALYGPM